MYKRDREKEIKTVLNRLEQLVLKAEKTKKELEEAYLEEDSVVDKSEIYEQEAYESGVYEAYAICKKVFEDQYYE